MITLYYIAVRRVTVLRTFVSKIKTVYIMLSVGNDQKRLSALHRYDCV